MKKPEAKNGEQKQRERERERERDDRDLRVNRECRLVHYRLGLGEYYIYRGWTSGVIYIYIYIYKYGAQHSIYEIPLMYACILI